ncbi:hypothetical protein JAB6_47200 [Janthinobacterium sp. HH104]|nr:hypothetical protein JAB6_47200 [Janthinobacterium sp. HH104]
MADARAVEHLPVGLRNGTLVAHHQRHDHARILLAFQAAGDARAQRCAAGLHHVAEAGHEGDQARIGRIGARLRPHVARGAHALLQQPRLVIETHGIRIAVRTLQPHREAPALARLHVAHGVRHCIAKTRVPGQGDQGRHLRPNRLFHGKVEAHALLEAVGQAGDGARNNNVLPFVSQCQLRRHGRLGQPRGPVKAEAYASGERNNAAPARVAAQRQTSRQPCTSNHPQQRARLHRQACLRLQPGGASGKAEYQGAHREAESRQNQLAAKRAQLL